MSGIVARPFRRSTIDHTKDAWMEAWKVVNSASPSTDNEGFPPWVMFRPGDAAHLAVWRAVSDVVAIIATKIRDKP